MTGKRNKGRKILAIMMALALFASVTAVPQSTYAAAKKGKAKYSITVHNINSNTVLRKGAKLKISYTAVKKTGGKTKGAKVRFKSSKKKVASVSKKGVIKAKKKGTAYITVYCKAKPGKKKKIKIRVGNPVSSIKVSGKRYLRVGRSNTLKASVNSGATNKSVTWWSDNPSVATVSGSGKITGVGSGTCTVYATAKDGSGVSGSRKVYVHQYYAGEAKWVAHRGLHTSATENTAPAFTAAGQVPGFWAIECDIWETAHEQITPDPLPEEPEGMGSGSEVSDAVNTVVSAVEALDLGAPSGVSILGVVDKRTGIEAAKSSYEALKPEEQYQVRTALGDDGLAALFTAFAKLEEYDKINPVINHDSTFSNGWGVHGISETTVRNNLSYVCFLDEFLRICKEYKKTPIIEVKDPSMSEEAIRKVVDMAYAGSSKEPVFISFYADRLALVKKWADAKNGSSKTYYLFSSNGDAGIDTAINCRFTGVSMSKSLISSGLYSRAKNAGLGVGTWTYKDKIDDDEYLYKHMFSYGWRLDFVTVDYRIFR